LLSTNTLRPRRTTTDPAFCFNALSEFLAFIVRRPFGPSTCFCRLLKWQPFSSGQNSGLAKTRAISHATPLLERCGGLPPGEMPMESPGPGTCAVEPVECADAVVRSL
jgi:hypothetical protein